MKIPTEAWPFPNGEESQASTLHTQLLAPKLQAGDQERQSLSGDQGVFGGHRLLSHADAGVQGCWVAFAARAAIASWRRASGRSLWILQDQWDLLISF